MKTKLIVNSSLFLAFIASFLVTVFSCGIVQNFFIAITVNLATILVTVNFVDYLFKRQDASKSKQKEEHAILRYHRTLEMFISRYIYYFNVITRPVEFACKENDWNSFNVSSEIINKEFKLSDMQDMYFAGFGRGRGETSLERYYSSETKLYDRFVNILDSIDFEFHPDLGKTILEFIEEYNWNDMKYLLLPLQTEYHNEKTGKKVATSKMVSDFLKNYKGNPETDIQGEYKNKGFWTGVFIFYFSLKNKSKFIEKYLSIISEIKKQK